MRKFNTHVSLEAYKPRPWERKNSKRFGQYATIYIVYIAASVAYMLKVQIFHIIHLYKLCGNCFAPWDEILMAESREEEPVIVEHSEREES